MSIVLISLVFIISLFLVEVLSKPDKDPIVVERNRAVDI